MLLYGCSCEDMYSIQYSAPVVGFVRFPYDELTCSYMLASLPSLISEAFRLNV